MLHLAQGLGPAFIHGLVKDLWSIDGHMLSITANILFGDLTDSLGTLIGGMPGTGKTRCVALIAILVAGVGRRKVLFASLQNEPVRSMMISLDERLSGPSPDIRKQFVRIPGVNESAKAQLRMDIEGNPMQPEAYLGISFVGVTCGKAELLHSNLFRSGFAVFLSEVWLVLRDEGQQAGPSSSTNLSAMIPKHAFEVWIGDHKQGS